MQQNIKDMKEVAEKEKRNIIDLCKTCEFNIDEKYEFVPEGKMFSLFSNLLYYGVAFPILKILMKIIYDLKIEGKENIKKAKNGAISVSNHVLFLDCAMVGLAYGKRKIYYTTQEKNFTIPFVRKLIKFLRAIPIPEKLENKKEFIKEIDKLLQNGAIVHFYPEGSLLTYHTKIRNFKNGAFDFAIRNKVDVIPMVYTFREPSGIRKMLKKKKDVTLTILEPIKYEENNVDKKEKINEINKKVHLEMNKIVKYK